MRIETIKLIKLYGQKIIIDYGDSEKNTYAFIQPLRKDEQSALYADYLNNNQDEQYLYIGLPENDICSHSESTITADNVEYKIIKAEKVFFSNKVIYERAVLEVND